MPSNEEPSSELVHVHQELERLRAARLSPNSENDRLDDHPVEDEPVLAIKPSTDPFAAYPGHTPVVDSPLCRPTAPCPACRQRLAEKSGDESLAVLPTEPRTLKEILFTHRALAGASALGITELMAELEPLFRQPAPTGITADALADARRQRDEARKQDQNKLRPLGEVGQREPRWIKQNPGLAALLQAVDGE